jgi:hypothetical protein
VAELREHQVQLSLICGSNSLRALCRISQRPLVFAAWPSHLNRQQQRSDLCFALDHGLHKSSRIRNSA